MQELQYNCTMLRGVNKAGTITPDEDGYYELILGALNFPNSCGAVYPLEHSKRYIEQNPVFLRRISTGQLRAEYGHPKRVPGMTREEFLVRIMTTEETRIAGHIHQVIVKNLALNIPDKGNIVVPCFIGKVKPSGPYGEYLEASLQNKKENVAFSVRSITRDKWIDGKLYKFFEEIFGWDVVNEPGLYPATKFQSPSLESMSIDLPTLKNVHTTTEITSLGLESANQLEHLIHRMEEIERCGDSRTTSAFW